MYGKENSFSRLYSYFQITEIVLETCGSIVSRFDAGKCWATTVKVQGCLSAEAPCHVM